MTTRAALPFTPRLMKAGDAPNPLGVNEKASQ